MAQHHKVESDLTAEHLEQLKSYVREKNYTRTTDDCHTWTLGHGYTIGRTAVGNWLAKFRIEDSQRASGELARTLIDAAKQEGTVAISDAATLQLSQMVFTQLLQMQAAGRSGHEGIVRREHGAEERDRRQETGGRAARQVRREGQGARRQAVHHAGRH
jgi:hypothetical protein